MSRTCSFDPHLSTQAAAALRFMSERELNHAIEFGVAVVAAAFPFCPKMVIIPKLLLQKETCQVIGRRVLVCQVR